jgi:hypothetical protein
MAENLTQKAEHNELDEETLQKLGKHAETSSNLKRFIIHNYDKIFQRVPQEYNYVLATANINDPVHTLKIDYFKEQYTPTGVLAWIKKLFKRKNPEGLIDYLKKRDPDVAFAYGYRNVLTASV